jgi:predicted extracellular nuclease
VGDPAALNALVAHLSGTWHVTLSTHPDTRGIRVGFLSHRRPATVEQVTDFPAELAPLQASDDGAVTTRTGRGALSITIDGIHLVTAHLKSKLITFPGGRFSPHDEGERARYAAYALYRRAAEAVTVRSHIDAILRGPNGNGRGADVPVVLLGDFNDTPDAATSQILLGPGGSELGTAGAARPDKGNAWRMWNLAPCLPAGAGSRVYRGRAELIDHILVSHKLLTPSNVRLITSGDLPSIADDPALRRNAHGSDHALITADVGD